jgi:hypothetical protein
MPNYLWVCHDCELFWDREYAIGKAPNRTRCSNCKKLCERDYQNSNIGISFKDDGCGNKNSGAGDFHTVKQRYRKFNTQGYDQDSANKFLHRSIKETKERQNDESYRYKPVYLRPDKLVETGEARKLSDKEVLEKVEKGKKLTANAYDKAKLDPSKPNKQY